MHLLILLIKIYQRLISPLLGPVCRFEPSCSHYGVEALSRFGAVKGSYLIIKRLLKCRPGGDSGSDPVPPKNG